MSTTGLTGQKKLKLESFNYSTLRQGLLFDVACTYQHLHIVESVVPYISMLLQVLPCFILPVFKISVADTPGSSASSSASTLATSLPLVDKNTEIMAKRRVVALWVNDVR